MHRTMLTAVVALLALVAGTLALSAHADEADLDEHMEAWIRTMAPGAPHAGLAERAGEWNFVVTVWHAPGDEPMTMKGVSRKTMILGGRYLEEQLLGEFMDRPFVGHGLTGFDNVTGEYRSVWLDNMSTGILLATGRDDGKGVQTYTSTMHDPSSGRPVPVRSVARRIDRDHHVFESYVTPGEGEEFLHMRVEYARVAP